MRVIHILGRKNQGKTTLVCALIAEARRRGLRVASIKHSAHEHPTDQPGSDSQRQAAAGAEPSIFISGSRIAIHRALPADRAPLPAVLPWLGDCDLVLVEGDREHAACAVEVVRTLGDEPPLAHDVKCIIALVSDRQAPLGLDLPIWPLGDPPRCLDHILALPDA